MILKDQRHQLDDIVQIVISIAKHFTIIFVKVDYDTKWQDEDFLSWGFEDEFMIELGGMPNHQNTRIWSECQGNASTHTQTKYPLKIMFAVVFSYDIKGELVIFAEEDEKLQKIDQYNVGAVETIKKVLDVMKYVQRASPMLNMT